METNTQTQLIPDKLKNIELKIPDKPLGGKYIRNAYIHNRYVGTIIGSKAIYYIHFHNTIQRTAIWADVWKILQTNYDKTHAKRNPSWLTGTASPEPEPPKKDSFPTIINVEKLI